MSLKPLASAKAPDLITFDRDGVAKEIMGRMKSMPGWSDIWVAEQYNDASQFVIQTFAYLFEKNAKAANRNVRESFLSESFSERAVYANLAQMRVDAIQNTASAVELVAKVQGAPLANDLRFPKQLRIPATGVGGGSVIFEVLPRGEDGEYDYTTGVVVEAGTFARSSFRVTAYAGETKSVSAAIEAYTLENSRIEVPLTDIIQGSVRAYYMSPGGLLTPLAKTTKFVVEPSMDFPSVFPNGTPHYIVRYGAGGSATVYFGSESFGGAFEESHIGGQIVVYCRVGGGATSNVPAGAINFNATIEVPGDRTYDINFSNQDDAYGGEDREDYMTAKAYAPLRSGRDGAIVLVDDAVAALYRSVVKHEIDTPKYSEQSPTVPLLHAFHYIVPKRDLSAWSPPEPYDLEPIDEYTARAFLSLNQFLGVAGTNGSPVLNEIVSDFVGRGDDGEYSFPYYLASQSPLSGTLSLTAWDDDDDRVDYLSWSGNYVAESEQASDTVGDHAEMASSAFSGLTILSTNNAMKFQMNGQPFTFSVTIPVGASVSAATIAASLQAQVVADILDPYQDARLYFGAYSGWTFFSAVPQGDGSTSKLVLTSPTVGGASRIDLVDHGQTPPDGMDQYDMLGIEVGTYRPPYETQLVFDASTYYHDDGRVDVMVNKSTIDGAQRSFAFQSAWEQDAGEVAGPEFTVQLTGERQGKLVKVVPNTELTIDAVYVDPETGESTVVDTLVYASIAESGASVPVVENGSGSVFNASAVANMEFTYDDSTAAIALNDGVLTDLYVQSFPAVTKMMVHEVELIGGSWTPVSPQPENYPLTFVESDCPNDDGEFAQWTQDVFSPVGPDTELRIGDKTGPGGGTGGDGLETGHSYAVTLYKTGDVQMDRAVLSWNGSDWDVVAPIETNGADTCLQYALCSYDAVDARVMLGFADPTLDTESPDYYLPGYDEFHKLVVTYQNKSYSYITAAYEPNPYSPTGEAAQYRATLMSSSRRMVGLEDIIKDVNFAPVGGTLTISIGAGFSEYDAYYAAKDALQENFGYDNSNPNHTIGVQLTADEVQSAVTNALAAGNGVRSVVFEPSNDFGDLDADTLARTYFFIPTDAMVEAVKQAESEQSTLSGLSQLFEVKISVTATRR